MKLVRFLILVTAVFLVFGPANAQHNQASVLWWNGMPEYPPQMSSGQRREMADYVDRFGNGRAFSVTFSGSTRGGALAAELASQRYDIIILDVTDRRRRLSASGLLCKREVGAAA